MPEGFGFWAQVSALGALAVSDASDAPEGPEGPEAPEALGAAPSSSCAAKAIATPAPRRRAVRPDTLCSLPARTARSGSGDPKAHPETRVPRCAAQ
ncbi:hypothetical protein GCM10027091_57700 [Streptomyces daliensis]